MRILFATTDVVSEDAAPSHQILYTCDGLVQSGCSVTLLHRGYVGEETKRQFPGIRFIGTAPLRFRGGGRIFPSWFARRLKTLTSSGNFDWLVVRLAPWQPVMRVLGENTLPVCAFHLADSLHLPQARAGSRNVRFFVMNSEVAAREAARISGFELSRFMVLRFSGVVPALFEGPVDRSAVLRSYGLDPGRPVLFHLSTFRAHHDFDTLLAALSLCSLPVQTVFAGEGARRDEIRTKAEQAGLSAYFPGSLRLEDAIRLMRASDICIDALTSTYAANGNLRSAKVFEFMASGVPVIETADPNLAVPDWAEQHLALVPPADPQALCNSISDILSNRDLWTTRAESARNWARKEQSWSAIARQCLDRMRATA